MYKGKKTFFYNGEILFDFVNGEYLVYSEEEQDSWEVIIVLPGVEVIPEWTFAALEKLETVVMSDDSVETIGRSAFSDCKSLKLVKFSRNLEYIGESAFRCCQALTSIFIPPSCREIGSFAFEWCEKLTILSLPNHTQLGETVISHTALVRASAFEISTNGRYDESISENVNEWIRNINEDDNEYALHRSCSSYNPLTDVLYQIVKRKGLISFKKKNEIGITPLEYLAVNPFAEHIDQKSLVKRYVLEMMGEAV